MFVHNAHFTTFQALKSYLLDYQKGPIVKTCTFKESLPFSIQKLSMYVSSLKLELFILKRMHLGRKRIRCIRLRTKSSYFTENVHV